MVGWLEHVYDSLLLNVKSTHKFADIVDLSNSVDDSLQALVNDVNEVFGPFVLMMVIKSFIVISNNAHWAISAKNNRARIAESAWVFVYISILILLFTNVESCRNKVCQI